MLAYREPEPFRARLPSGGFSRRMPNARQPRAEARWMGAVREFAQYDDAAPIGSQSPSGLACRVAASAAECRMLGSRVLKHAEMVEVREFAQYDDAAPIGSQSP